MSRYRRIDMRLYGDEKYRRLSPCPPCGQAIWWHLIAGEQTGHIPGLFKIGEQSFAEQLGWSMKGFREAFQEVFREGMAKADWKARLVFVPNSIKYNQPANPNVVKSWGHAWDELPECRLKVEAHQRLLEYMESLGKGFAEAFRNTCRNPFGNPLPNHEQEQEQEQEHEQEQEQEKEKGVGFEIPQTLESGAFRKVWDEWLTYRRQAKKTITSATAKKQLAMLEGFGVEKAILSIETSIRSGWAGLFEPAAKRHSPGRDIGTSQLFKGTVTPLPESS